MSSSTAPNHGEAQAPTGPAQAVQLKDTSTYSQALQVEELLCPSLSHEKQLQAQLTAPVS